MSEDADVKFNAGSAEREEDRNGNERGSRAVKGASKAVPKAEKESTAGFPIPELTDGFHPGMLPENILGARKVGGEIMFLVKWKDRDVADLVPSHQAREKCPQLVIDFYESQFGKFITEDPEAAGAEKESSKTGNAREDDSNQGERDAEEAITDGGKDPLLILPKEMWVKILDHVSDPAARWSCIATCSLFDKLLSEWKLMMMGLEQALPYFYFRLSRLELLNCRAVSKGWKERVDHFLEEHPSQRPFRSDVYKPSRLDFIFPLTEKRFGDDNYGTGKILIANSCTYPFTSIDDPFFEGMKGANPFLGRNIILHLQTAEIEHEWWNKLLEFLELFGKEIWYLELRLQLKFPCLLNRLVELFPFLPNIRKLMLRFFVMPYSRFPDDVTNSLSTIPLPSTLETLEVRDGSGASNPSTLLFQRHCSQLRKIHLDIFAWRQVSHLGWPNLSELSVTIYEPDMCSYLLGVGSRMPLLEKLTLKYDRYIWNTSDLEFRKQFLKCMFHVVDDLTATTKLRVLQINARILQDKDATLWREVGTANRINTLILDLSYDYPSIDFLSHCFPSVENVIMFVVKGNYGRGHDDDSCVRLKKLTRNFELDDELYGRTIYDMMMMSDMKKVMCGRCLPYNSNIWKLLPHLKVLTLQKIVYTRYGYEQHLAYGGDSVESDKREDAITCRYCSAVLAYL